MKPQTLLLSLSAISVAVGSFFLVSTLRPLPETLGSRLDLTTIRGDELAVVLIVSPNCSACDNPHLPNVWSTIVDRYEAEATRQGARLSLTGVSISPDVHRGVSFLERFGTFHEISVGRGWENLGAMRYVTQGLMGPQSVPQVLVVRREVEESPSGRPTFSNELVVQRRIGLASIFSWALQSHAVKQLGNVSTLYRRDLSAEPLRSEWGYGD
jgi:hypothetical protein